MTGAPGHLRASRACPDHHLSSGSHLFRGAMGPALGQPHADSSEDKTQKPEHPGKTGWAAPGAVLRGSGHRTAQALQDKKNFNGKHSRPASAAGREVAQGTCGTRPPRSVAGVGPPGILAVPGGRLVR